MKSWKRTFDFLGPRKNSSSDWICLFLDAPWESIAIPFLHRERFIPSHKSNLPFFVWFSLFVMVMQCKRSEIRLFLMMKRAFILCDIFFENPIKVGNLRRRLSVFDGQIPTVGISLKAQTERINGLLEGYLSHFSANQKDWSCWMLLSAAIT